MRPLPPAAALCLIAAPVFAEPPQVVADIPPVAGLAQMVMGELGEIELLLSGGEDPHHISLKPSQARAMAKADVVVWVGPSLSPQLAESLETLAPDAHQIILTEIAGTHLLDYRDVEDFTADHDPEDAAHDDGYENDHGHTHAADEGAHDDHGHDDHGHDDHEHADAQDDHEEDHGDHEDGHDAHAEGHDDHEHAHDDHAEDHDDHGDDHAGHDGHEGHNHAGGIDPHVWLSADNAIIWLYVLAEEFAEQDPQNAQTYRANAKTAAGLVIAAKAEAADRLAPIAGKPIAVYHDAFQYFEESFGLSVVGALTDSEAAPSGPAQLDALRAHLAEAKPVCILAEPGANLKLIRAVAPDVAIAELDQLATGMAVDSALYPQMILKMADAIAECGHDH